MGNQLLIISILLLSINFTYAQDGEALNFKFDEIKRTVLGLMYSRSPQLQQKGMSNFKMKTLALKKKSKR
jgi:hypothetical protein